MKKIIGNKLRILVDGHVLDGYAQGSKTYINGLWGEIKPSDNVMLYVACNKKSSFDQSFANLDCVQFIKYRFSSRISRLIFELPFICWKYKIDYLNVTYVGPLVKNTKWIVTLHDLLFMDFPEYFPKGYSFLRFIFFTITAKRADRIATISHYSRQRIEKLIGVDPKKLTLTPCAVDGLVKEELKEITKFAGKKFFLYVSRIEPRKNQAVLIEALKAVEDKNCILVFVGAQAINYPQFEELIKDSDIKNRIHIIRASDSELVWLYRNAVACFYPSHCEGFGIPPIEAKIFGALSFIADNTALSELTPYVDGCFDPDNASEITSIMNECVSLSRQPNEEGAQVISANFCWRKSLENLLADLSE